MVSGRLVSILISDRDGIPNLYRLTLAGGNISQLTNLQTGVSGISIWSPALSVAAKADRLVFGVYADGNYSLYAMEGSAALAGNTPGTAVSSLNAGMKYRSQEQARALGIARRPVSSYGGTLRVNVLGYFIVQLSYVHANDRPLRRWGWEFGIVPGF